MTEKNKLQEYCQKNQIPMPIYKSWSNGEHHKLSWSASVNVLINGKNVIIDTIVPTTTKTSAEKQAAVMMLDYIFKKKDKSLLTKLRERTKLNVTSTHKTIFKNYELSDEDVIDAVENDDTQLLENDDIQLSENGNGADDITILRVHNKNDLGDEKQLTFDICSQKINEIYLLDLENKPVFKRKLKNNVLYIGFLNSIHHSIEKYNKWYKCRSDNIYKELLESKNNKLLYLIDGGTTDLVDHFMSTMIYPLVDFINSHEILPKIIIVSGDHAGWCTRTCLEKILKWRKITNIDISNVASI